MAFARDKFWLFASRAHGDDILLGKSDEGRFSRWSRITPAEGAFMLDIPNMIMVVSDGIPASFSKDAYGYMESFCRMNSVLWSSTGSGGFRVGTEEKFICELAGKYKNIKGSYLDDFYGIFSDLPKGERELKIRETLAEIRAGLDKACRPMEIWTTWYTHNLNALDNEIIRCLDGITLWTWTCSELPLVEERFGKIEKLFPNKKKLLGVYIYDYPSGKSVPDDLMELQCNFGLRMLKEGRMDGMVFLTNCVMSGGFSSEYWLKDWIDKVKYTQIPN